MLRDFSNRQEQVFVEDQKVTEARKKFRNAVVKQYIPTAYYEDDDSENGENLPTSQGQRQLLAGVNRRSSFNSTTNTLGPEGEPELRQPSFGVRLFDRGIDLTQFTNSTPLYPLCRAWFWNEPYRRRQQQQEDNDNKDSSPPELDEEDDKARMMEIHQLPGPSEPLPDGCFSSVRVPLPIPRENVEFDINSEDEFLEPTSLFRSHLNRWAEVKQRWRESCWDNEKRYARSLSMLEQVHRRSSVPEPKIKIETSIVDDTEH